MNLIQYKYISENYIDDGWLKESQEPSIAITFKYDFGFIKINLESVSHMVQDRLIDVCVPFKFLDEFLCFAFRNKICLVEKFRTKERALRYISKNLWTHTELYDFKHNVNNFVMPVDEDSFIFKDFKFNYVTMNNNTNILVLV